tara:strand:- start:180 stop:362 length:183 start_codon:yes stop_codon:yes gene_type:complete
MGYAIELAQRLQFSLHIFQLGIFHIGHFSSRSIFQTGLFFTLSIFQAMGFLKSEGYHICG